MPAPALILAAALLAPAGLVAAPEEIQGRSQDPAATGSTGKNKDDKQQKKVEPAATKTVTPQKPEQPADGPKAGAVDPSFNTLEDLVAHADWAELWQAERRGPVRQVLWRSVAERKP